MIVEEEQYGENRAAYGKKILQELSEYLSEYFGKGFSVSNLKNIRQFYKVYSVDQIGETVFSEFAEKKRMDNAEEKRVELHLHTQMSQMDAVSSATDLIKTAIKWGHKAIAITDHGVAQSYPEAKKAAKDSDIKVIYGVEAYLCPDNVTSVYEAKSTEPLDDLTYCVLDIETTGLSRQTEKITEFGIMKMKNGEVIDTFECFVRCIIAILFQFVQSDLAKKLFL